MAVSILIFCAVYFVIATGKMEKTAAALLGAAAVIAFHLISFDQAARAVDLNVLGLLIGLTTCVAVLAGTGVFEWAAISLAKLSRGNAVIILGALQLVTMISAALFDNMTTIVLLVPVTILITQLLEVPAAPFLILEIIAANTGGAATMIGDPSNMMIGSRAKISFGEFLCHTAPCAFLGGAAVIIISMLVMRGKMHVPVHIRARVINSYPSLALRDARRLPLILGVFGFLLLGLLFGRFLHWAPGLVAMTGMAVMLVVCGKRNENPLRFVDWNLILCFAAFFVIAGALEACHATAAFGRLLAEMSGRNMFAACVIVLVGSALFSAVFDNILFTAAMIPLVQKTLECMGAEHTGAQPLFWALALGACLGGGGALTGS